MSYCVNCGVELDATLKDCPLCNTPVINPSQLKEAQKRRPFPEEKVPVEMIKRKDMGLLVSIVLIAIAVTCGGLNLLVFKENYWSLAIIGACLLLWVILLPEIVYHKLNVYLAVFLDGVAVVVYLYLLTWLTESNDWFYGVAVEIVLFITVLLEIYILCLKVLPKSILTYALYSVTALGILCVGLELLIDKLVRAEISMDWSAIIATICIVIDVALICVLSMRRLRNAVRRRLHF